VEKTGPLNVDLYEALRAAFGEVKIANEGIPMQSRLCRDPYDLSKWSEKIIEPGEEYRICCPFCSDSKYRLYINYKWRQANADGRSNWSNLVHCFNEECDTAGLEGMVKPYVANRPYLTRKAAKTVDVQMSRVPWPGECVKLSALPHSHPAIQYLQGRKFDPLEIESMWDVKFCVACDFSPRYMSAFVVNRLVVPIYWEREMVGWQTRAIVEGITPKYYTMPGLRKQYLLYNGDRAAMNSVGVLVEGVTDAWRVGQRACALLGKSISAYQRDWLFNKFSSGWLINLLDPDALDDLGAVHKTFNPELFNGKYIIAKLPDGTDAGGTDRDVLYRFLNARLREGSSV
jgi:hypothetical protein